MMSSYSIPEIHTLKKTLLDHLNPFLIDHSAPNYSSTIAVACSGGRDSMLLTELCMQVLMESFSECQLLVFTVDHGLHTHSKAFAKAVVKYWQTRGIDAYHLQANPHLISQGSGIEDGARQARYEALKQAKLKYSVGVVLFGHHAGDQAESVLMRLQSSSGIQGLSGIPKQREWILRPWLEISPFVVEQVFQQLTLPLYEDPSNQDLRFLRNAIRHQISPQCAKVFGSGWEDRIARSAKHLSEDAEVYSYFLKGYMEDIVKDYSSIGRFRLKWSLDPSAPLALEKAVIRQFYTSALRSFSRHNDQRRVKEQIQYLWKVWTSNKTQKLSLPHGLKAWGMRYELWIYCESYFPQLPTNHQVCIDSTLWHRQQDFSVKWAEWSLDFRYIHEISTLTQQKSESSHLISIPKSFALHLRLPLPGERFLPYAAPGSKRVTRLWSDRKVPIFERKRLPVLSNNEGKILWAPHCRPHHELMPHTNSKTWLLTWRIDNH